MATFTITYLNPTLPEKSSLQPIGSVAANFARTSTDESRDEHTRFSHHSSLADLILATHGDAAYADFIACEQAKAEAEREWEAKRLARRQKREELVQRYRKRLKKLLMRGAQKFGRRAAAGAGPPFA